MRLILSSFTCCEPSKLVVPSKMFLFISYLQFAGCRGKDFSHDMNICRFHPFFTALFILLILHNTHCLCYRSNSVPVVSYEEKKCV